MFPRTAALFVFIAAGCAGPQKETDFSLKRASSSGLYVGHSTSGDVVLAASHYDAMAGLATTAGELGLKDTGKGEDNKMMCQREMPTGTHVPRWVCRYEDQIRMERQQTQDILDGPKLSFAGRGGAMQVLLGRGGGGTWNRGTLVP
jgi:hypothetical protein